MEKSSAKDTPEQTTKSPSETAESKSFSHPLLGIQSAAGNRTTQRLLTTHLQANSILSHPSDSSERQADHVADHIVSLSKSTSSCSCGGSCSKCKPDIAKSPARLQRKKVDLESGDQSAMPTSVRDVLRSAGQPLDSASRAEMENRFGVDFSHVRVHSGAGAEESARDVKAQAYTVGSDVVFGSGRFAPRTREGQRLIAHELTHVVQQSSNGGLRVGSRGNSTGPVIGSTGRAGASVIQRFCEEGDYCDTGYKRGEDPSSKPAPKGAKVTPPVEPNPDGPTIDQFDLIGEISNEFSQSFAGNNAAVRGQRLLLLFKKLEPDYARRTEQIVVSGKLRAQFQQIPEGIRKQLATVLAEKKKQTITQRPGIFGKGVRRLNELDYYMVRDGITLDELARYLSDDPSLAAVLAATNHISQDKSLTAGTQIFIPKDLPVRGLAATHRRQDISSGTFIYPTGGFTASHAGDRTWKYNDIPLTKSEFDNLQENQIEQAHGKEALRTIAEDRARHRDEDLKRAKIVPSSFMTVLFPSSILYVKDQSLLIKDPMLQMKYRANQQAFQAGTNFNRMTGAVAIGSYAAAYEALILAPVAVEGVAALGGTGVGESLLYGGRYLYLNAPQLYGSAMLYGGAILTGAALGQHTVDIRSRGFNASEDIPRFAEDLLPLASGHAESLSFGGGGGGGPKTDAPRVPGWLRNRWLAATIRGADFADVTPGIGAGGTDLRPVPTLVRPSITISAPSPSNVTPDPVWEYRPTTAPNVNVNTSTATPPPTTASISANQAAVTPSTTSVAANQGTVTPPPATTSINVNQAAVTPPPTVSSSVVSVAPVVVPQITQQTKQQVTAVNPNVGKTAQTNVSTSTSSPTATSTTGATAVDKGKKDTGTPTATTSTTASPITPTRRYVTVTGTGGPATPLPGAPQLTAAQANQVRQRIETVANKNVIVGIQATVNVKGDPVSTGMKSAQFSEFDTARAAALGGTGRAAVLPQVSQPPKTAAKKGTQPSAGVIVQPQADARSVEVMAWNTSAPERGHNVSHAERQFINWFEGQDKAWTDRVTSVNVIVLGREICPLCASDIRDLQRNFPHITFNFIRGDQD